MTETPKRPEGIPANAIYDPETPGFEWVQVGSDDEGRRHGELQAWNLEGVLHRSCTYEHGEIKGDNTHYHPDGSVSAVATYRNGVSCDTFYYKCENESDEPWPDCGDGITKVGYYSLTGGSNETIRYFTADDVEVASDGSPLPDRPESVSQSARYFPEHDFWVDGAIQRGTNAQIGQWRWWSVDGSKTREEFRGDDGTVLGIWEFNGEKIKTHKEFYLDGSRQFERSFTTTDFCSSSETTTEKIAKRENRFGMMTAT